MERVGDWVVWVPLIWVYPWELVLSVLVRGVASFQELDLYYTVDSF